MFVHRGRSQRTNSTGCKYYIKKIQRAFGPNEPKVTVFSCPAASLGGLKDHEGLRPDSPLISRREDMETQKVTWWSVSIHHQCRGEAGPASPGGASGTGPLAGSKARMALQEEKGGHWAGPSFRSAPCHYDCAKQPTPPCWQTVQAWRHGGWPGRAGLQTARCLSGPPAKLQHARCPLLTYKPVSRDESQRRTPVP